MTNTTEVKKGEGLAFKDIKVLFKVLAVGFWLFAVYSLYLFTYTIGIFWADVIDIIIPIIIGVGFFNYKKWLVLGLLIYILLLQPNLFTLLLFVISLTYRKHLQGQYLSEGSVLLIVLTGLRMWALGGFMLYF